MLPARAIALAAAAAVIVSVIQACSGTPENAPPQNGLPPGTASISINDEDTGRTYPVTCSQIRWLLTIETHESAPGFTVLVEQGAEVTAKFVKIRNVGGFTGSYWRDAVGDGQAALVRDMYSITGTAYGVHTGGSGPPTDATFKITAAC